MYDDILGTTRAPRTPRTRNQPVVDVDPYGAHKPGFRIVTDAARGTVDAGQVAKDAAYNEMVADLQDAWKSPEQRAADARQVTDARPPAGVSAAEFEHARMVQDMCTAWMPKADAVPSGKWPRSAGVGSACDLNGERGVLVDDGSGFLVCQVNRHVGPTRNDAAPPRFMDAATAQKIKDAAWLESVERVSNAWKVQG
jgi:hypothetical protein